MKNQKDFIRQYRKADFPFKEIIACNKELRKALFKEFTQTKQKHCFDLYLLDHYTDRQWNDRLIEAARKIPTSVSNNSNIPVAASWVQTPPFEFHFDLLRNEFGVSKKTLDAKYYCFDLEATNTVKTLQEIGKVIELFKKVLITHDNIDFDTEAKNVSKTILRLMEGLEDQKLKDGVFTALLNDKENADIVLEHFFDRNKESGLEDKYSRLKMYFDNYLKEGNVKALPAQQTETKKEQPKAPVVALFCSLVNDAELIEKAESESVESYCMRVCNHYKLTYTDRVRQNFNGCHTKENKKKLAELLLPFLESEVSKRITDYLNRKEPPKQNLYA